MNRPMLVAAVSTLLLAACAQKQEAAPPAPPAPAAVATPAPAPVAAAPATESAQTAEPVGAADLAKPAVDVATLPGDPKLQQK